MSALNSYLFQGNRIICGFFRGHYNYSTFIETSLLQLQIKPRLSTHESKIFQVEAAIFWTYNEKQINKKEFALFLGIVSRKN